MYLKKTGDVIAGMAVIDAEPKELALVHLDGRIDPEELSQLRGHSFARSIGS